MAKPIEKNKNIGLPAALHLRVKRMAVERGTTLRAEVITAVEGRVTSWERDVRIPARRRSA